MAWDNLPKFYKSLLKENLETVLSKIHILNIFFTVIENSTRATMTSFIYR